MSGTFQVAERSTARQLILEAKRSTLTEDEDRTLTRILSASEHTWVGIIDGEPVCVWGLIPPTLLSDTAYLWLYTTEKVEEHKFLFVRRSQLAMEEMLKQYPRIIGVCHKDNRSARRWLRWLGATFGEVATDDNVPFVIRQRHG